MTTMSSANSLAVLRDPRPTLRNQRHLQLLVVLTLAWLAVVFAYTIYPGRGGHPAQGVAEINVGPFVVVLPGTETPFPIQVGPAEWIPARGWIRIAGLPVLATLSDGYVTQPGVWKVPVEALPTLKLRSPPMEGFTTEVTIALLSANDAIVSEVRTALAVVPTSQNLAARCDAEGGDQTSACQPDRPALAWILSGARREVEHIMRWGDDALARGSIGAARNIYRYAAIEMRWPAAALALAATYDPHELALLAPLVSPDEKEARKWYAQAQEMVNAQLSFYLQRLDQPKGLRDPLP
jgi:hypothetical protein